MIEKMTPELICLSCKKRITNIVGTVRFPCPKCGKSEIIRCKNCRIIAAKYECPQCHFQGPH